MTAPRQSTSLKRLFPGRRRDAVARTFKGALAAEHLVQSEVQLIETAANRSIAVGQLALAA